MGQEKLLKNRSGWIIWSSSPESPPIFQTGAKSWCVNLVFMAMPAGGSAKLRESCRQAHHRRGVSQDAPPRLGWDDLQGLWSWPARLSQVSRPDGYHCLPYWLRGGGLNHQPPEAHLCGWEATPRIVSLIRDSWWPPRPRLNIFYDLHFDLEERSGWFPPPLCFLASSEPSFPYFLLNCFSLTWQFSLPGSILPDHGKRQNWFINAYSAYKAENELSSICYLTASACFPCRPLKDFDSPDIPLYNLFSMKKELNIHRVHRPLLNRARRPKDMPDDPLVRQLSKRKVEDAIR